MALLHLSLILGAPLGEYTLGGTHRVSPMRKRILSGFIFCFFVSAGLAYLQRAEQISPILNDLSENILLIIYTIFLACAIISNAFFTKSKKERVVMTPLTIVGFISSIFVLLNT